MNEAEFRKYLRKGGRSPNAVERCVKLVREFEHFIAKDREEAGSEDIGTEQILEFIEDLESERSLSAKTHLWALRYYFEFTSAEHLSELAKELRQERIDRKPFALDGFRGVDTPVLHALEEQGIVDIQQMLDAGSTSQGRSQLAEATGVEESTILELVKLSNLARIPGVKGIRARLYHDAGIDTLEKMAAAEPIFLREMLLEFVERTQFDGIAPLPKEIEYTIGISQTLERIVVYDK